MLLELLSITKGKDVGLLDLVLPRMYLQCVLIHLKDIICILATFEKEHMLHDYYIYKWLLCNQIKTSHFQNQCNNFFFLNLPACSIFFQVCNCLDDSWYTGTSSTSSETGKWDQYAGWYTSYELFIEISMTHRPWERMNCFIRWFWRESQITWSCCNFFSSAHDWPQLLLNYYVPLVFCTDLVVLGLYKRLRAIILQLSSSIWV